MSKDINAIGIVRQMVADGQISQEVAEKYFPELKESRDEKTKRVLHSIANKMGNHLRDIFTEEEFQCYDAWSNAWLEKQGEQKHQYNSRPRYVGEEELLGTNKQGKCPFLKQELIDMGFAFTQDGDLAYPIHKIEKKEFAAWSEEDEKMLDGIIEASTHHCYLNITDINWLKFLKERYTWKPSKEQLHILESVIADYDNQGLSYTKDMLCDLYEQLKKL